MKLTLSKSILKGIKLSVPSFALTTALSQVLKTFQNPIWAEQARERLKQIKMLTKVADATHLSQKLNIGSKSIAETK